MGDAARGAEIFKRKCVYCHNVANDENLHGPYLHKLFGRKAGIAEGFPFSKAHREKNITWNDDTLFEYLENPRAFIPGTSKTEKMFAGFADPQMRRDVVAYLKTATK
jgi:cytochrome c